MKLSLKLLVIITLYGFLIFACSQTRNNAPLSKNSPTDKPHTVQGAEQLEKYDKLIKPYVEQAKKTLPQAKEKFQKGLRAGEAFFLVIRIFDSNGNYEQVFVRVEEWNDENIQGNIANDLNTVKGFTFGQSIEFNENSVLDWLISKPDGTEEGNFIGKFLDTLN